MHGALRRPADLYSSINSDICDSDQTSPCTAFFGCFRMKFVEINYIYCYNLFFLSTDIRHA